MRSTTSNGVPKILLETIKENQESELINNPDYGLLSQVTESQRIFPLTGAPTPDDMDELLTKVWKEPAFFLTHPLGIAAFGREATWASGARASSACSSQACRASRVPACRCASWASTTMRFRLT
jgi:hypothetical protein